VDSRAGLSMRESVMGMWKEAGVDPAEAMKSLAAERETIQAALRRSGGRRGPIRGFVIPTLNAIGLFSDRIRGHFEDMFVANLGAQLGTLKDDPLDLPEDLEAWVEGA